MKKKEKIKRSGRGEGESVQEKPRSELQRADIEWSRAEVRRVGWRRGDALESKDSGG